MTEVPLLKRGSAVVCIKFYAPFFYKIHSSTIFKAHNLLSINQLNDQVKLLEVWKSRCDPIYPVKWNEKPPINSEMQTRYTKTNGLWLIKTHRFNFQEWYCKVMESSSICYHKLQIKMQCKNWNQKIHKNFAFLTSISLWWEPLLIVHLDLKNMYNS